MGASTAPAEQAEDHVLIDLTDVRRANGRQYRLIGRALRAMVSCLPTQNGDRGDAQGLRQLLLRPAVVSTQGIEPKEDWLPANLAGGLLFAFHACYDTPAHRQLQRHDMSAAHKIDDLAVKMTLTHLGQIRKYLEDDEVQEVLINSPNDLWIDRRGELIKIPETIPEESLRGAVRTIAAANQQEERLIMDARLPGIRVAIAMPPAVPRIAMTLRKHRSVSIPLSAYRQTIPTEGLNRAVNRPSFDHPVDYIEWMIAKHMNFVIAGSTSSGKTTFLNAVIDTLDRERVITIEDTPEFILHIPHYVNFWSVREHNVDIRALVRLSLRFRPDRIFVGEVRDGAAYDMIDAMGSGHRGSGCSLHADSAADTLYRLERLVKMHDNARMMPPDAVREMIGTTIDVVIFCARRGAVRGPVEILEVKGYRDGSYVTERVL